MTQLLEKSEGRELVSLLDWETILPENNETHRSSPTDREFSVSTERTVEVGEEDVRKAYSVKAESGQKTYMTTFTADTAPGRYLEEVHG